MREAYDACAPAPDFSALDRLLQREPGETLKGYSNPGFFLDQWAAKELEKLSELKKEKARPVSLGARAPRAPLRRPRARPSARPERRPRSAAPRGDRSWGRVREEVAAREACRVRSGY